MKRMLDLLYVGYTRQAFNKLSNKLYARYFLDYGLGIRMGHNDLTTMLLLIAVAEGEQL